MAIVLAVFSGLVVSCLGHGRLQVPKTRFHVINNADLYENSPVSGPNGADYACRNDPQNVPTENSYTAGETMKVKWLLTADHVGDCALSISYDWSKSGEDRKNMQFFKIANWFDCRAFNQADVTVQLPDWLPAGRAVIRWDWYALHLHPTLEYFVQCADVNIVGGLKSMQVSQVPRYSVVGLWPEQGTGKLRYPWETAQGFLEQFMGGPPCACQNSKANGCPLTADPNGTGYIAVPTMKECGGNDVVVTPKPTTKIVDGTGAPTAAGKTREPTAKSTGSGKCPAECSVSACRTFNGRRCDLWCSEWGFCGDSEDHKLHDCRACGDNGPVPTPAPITMKPTSDVVDCEETIKGMLKGKSVKHKKVKTVCDCRDTCKDSVGFTYSAKKMQCHCVSKPKVNKKKNKWLVKNKKDFVYGSFI